MKVIMGTDIEGVAGVVSFTDQAYPDGRYYDAAKKLLTAEINAAADGLLDAGATEIMVFDGHGPGAVHFEDLHPEVKLIHGRPTSPRYVRDRYVKDFDVCVMIGQHAMAGIQTSNMNHTQSSKVIDYYKLNGKLIGETAQFALYHGDFGIPLIFLSGEADACDEAEALIPEITTANVKQGLSRGSAISISAQKSRALIRKKIAEALEKHKTNPIPPLVWESPYILEKRFFHTHEADAAETLPGYERIDGQTVQFKGDNIREVIYR
jgi:D-amino peptidase